MGAVDLECTLTFSKTVWMNGTLKECCRTYLCLVPVLSGGKLASILVKVTISNPDLEEMFPDPDQLLKT